MGKIQLSDHFNYGRLIRFTLPPVLMMIFTSIYNMVDGYFVSNFVGKTPFAAVNIIWPYMQLWGCLGFMFGTGGCALVSKVMGEGDSAKADRYFSVITYVAIAAGVVAGVISFVTLRPVGRLLGADGQLLDYCIRYGRVIAAAMPLFVLQGMFQPFMIAAERPKLGMWVTIGAGLSNMALDWLFVGILRWGVEGAALASDIGMLVGGLLPLWYFMNRKQRSRLHILAPWRTGRDGYAAPVLKACLNGMSELVSNVSLSLVSMLYNLQLLRLAGENGVSAYGVVMYVNMVFLAIFLGYSMGVSPVVSFHYGACNRSELKGLRRKSMTLLSVVAVCMTISAELLAEPLARIFVGYDEQLVSMTRRAFALYSFSFLLAHFNIFGSAFFTALNDGVRSAVISFSRMLLFQVPCVLLLPKIWGLDGIWVTMVVAEALSLLVTGWFFVSCRDKYGY